MARSLWHSLLLLHMLLLIVYILIVLLRHPISQHTQYNHPGLISIRQYDLNTFTVVQFHSQVIMYFKHLLMEFNNSL